MIDLHCHILDGTLCGPESFAESLEMCRLAVADGVRQIVATPRWDAQANEPPIPFADCTRKLERLQHEMGGALSFKLGFMMRFSVRLPELVKQYGSKITLGGGRYLLVALPSLGTPAEAEEVWSELSRCGVSVVLTHPECSLDLRRNEARLERWFANGVILQIDAASITGSHGREVQRFATQWLRKYEGRVVVASNAHDASPRRPSLSSAREELVKRVGARQTRALVSEMPAAIINHIETRPKNGAKTSPGRITALLRSLRITGEITDPSIETPNANSYH